MYNIISFSSLGPLYMYNGLIDLKILKGQRNLDTKERAFIMKIFSKSKFIKRVEESRLRKYGARVVPCPGATIKDIYHHITPYLKNKPSKVFVHVGTNDSPFRPSDDIVRDLLLLRKFIESNIPGCKVFLSGK